MGEERAATYVNGQRRTPHQLGERFLLAVHVANLPYNLQNILRDHVVAVDLQEDGGRMVAMDVPNRGDIYIWFATRR